MKYEIITDKEDLHVLVVNSNIVEISRDMSSIMHTMWDIYTKRATKTKRNYLPAVINLEEYEIPTKEDILIDVDTNTDKEPSNGSLGKLLGLQ